MDYITITILILLTVFLYNALNTLSTKRSSKKQPPGPSPLPIIGNLHVLSKHAHKSFSDLAQKYGPIMSIKLGQLPAVVITSPEVARQVLLKQDEAFANRWAPNAMQALNHHEYSVVFLPATPRWKILRKAMSTSLFSTSRLEATQHIRSRKVNDLIEYCRRHGLRGEAVHIDLAAFITSVNVLSCSLFSKDVMGTDSGRSTEEMREVMWRIAEVSGEPNMMDFFNFVKFDFQGIKRRLATHFEKVIGMFSDEINQRLDAKMKKRSNNNSTSDALDLLLTFFDNNPRDFDHTRMQRLLLDLFIAGSDTTSSSLEWAMAELLKNPTKLRKVKEELMQVVGKGKPLEDPDLDRLPYLQCIVKETFRLHPPIPTLLPRMVHQDVELCGYTIPKETRILVNVWAIGRDPNIWENPLEFKPERFLGSNINLRGFDFELLPFGSGRRVCPGMPLARRLVPLMLGSLLNSFDWKLKGDITPEELDMEEKVGIALQKAQPLEAIPIPL